MTPPKIFELDPEQSIAESKAFWEQGVGKTILPAQPEFQQILSIANREIILRALGDYATAQNLTQFATAPILDYKAANVGLTRLDRQPATTTLRFNLMPGHFGVTIPSFTRVSTQDGQIEFATDYERVVAAGVESVDIDATAIDAGAQANNQPVGAIRVLVTGVSFVQSVTNTVATEGGSGIESDEQLRKRIMLAPSQTSSGGTKTYYKFHTMSVNPRIIDATIMNGANGLVNVYPLVEGGIVTPSAILDSVTARLTDDSIKPINDSIQVISPTRIEYTVVVGIQLRWGAVQSTTVERVVRAIEEYCASQAEILGADIKESQLVTAAMRDNMSSVMSVSVDGGSGPIDLAVPPTAFAVCAGVTVGVVVYENPNT